jgi:hypothetical protein
MIKRRNKKNVPLISSSDEAVEKIDAWCEDSFPDYADVEIDVSDSTMIRLRALVRKIWEDAYQTGRDDARSDASIKIWQG